MAHALREIAKRFVTSLSPDLKALMFRGAFGAMEPWQRDVMCREHQIASVGWSLRQLRSRGFLPRRALDVGAYRGDWTRTAREVFPGLPVLMIDAQTGKRPLLEQLAAESDGRVSYEIALLGAESRDQVAFYEMETGSSVLAEQSAVPRATVIRPMTTLDQVLRAHPGPPADFVKLDVQGYELEILRGGTACLSEASVVMMEVSLIAVNQGAPLMHEVISFMHDAAFRPYDICSFIRRQLDGALWQVDMIFVHERSALVANERFDH